MYDAIDPIREALSSRRRFLSHASCGFGALALAGLCDQAFGSTRQQVVNSLVAKSPHFAPRAKRVIFLFMQGGPSQVDTFDFKPALQARHGEKMPFHVARTRKTTDEPIMGSPWKFRRHGQCGRWVSELFPHMAQHVDDLCFIRSMHTEGVAHGPSTLMLHTGATALARPSVGAWVMYGLGTENQNLPGFISINPSARMGGPRNYANAFLPADCQGTTLGRVGVSSKQAKFQHITNEDLAPERQARQFSLLQRLNRQQLERHTQSSPVQIDQLEGVINSFELAYRMQMNAPGLTDISGEPESIKRMYGIGEKPTDEYGRQCLLARRFAEAGVRYIQVNYSDNSSNPKWDQHSNLPDHAKHAQAVDQPVAGLLADLKARGLLEDTLVWWGGEFGRTPFAQANGTGRDHNPGGFTIWLAGGGVKPGYIHGETDEFGHHAVKDKVHMHDLHATVLHLLGINHEELTYRHAGRDFRLTDVYGEIVRSILA